jgi:hypothetical protein
MPVEGRDDEVVVVTVTKPFASYNENETVAFLPEYAQELEAQGFVVIGGSAGGPLNVELPYVSQTGTTLNCTMGIWTGDPDTYAYQWNVDGANVGSGGNSHNVTLDDVGKPATCAVTAGNEAGTATATSNAVVISTLEGGVRP